MGDEFIPTDDPAANREQLVDAVEAALVRAHEVGWLHFSDGAHGGNPRRATADMIVREMLGSLKQAGVRFARRRPPTELEARRRRTDRERDG